VELVGNAGEGGAKILAAANLRVAAATLFGDAREAAVRQIRQQHRLQTRASDPGRRSLRGPAAETDRVDHSRNAGFVRGAEAGHSYVFIALRAATLSIVIGIACSTK